MPGKRPLKLLSRVGMIKSMKVLSNSMLVGLPPPRGAKSKAPNEVERTSKMRR